jgi:hypothetical protein
MKMYYTGAFTNLNYPKQLLRLYFLMIKVDQAYFVIYLDGDHSLSRKKDLRRICLELRKMTVNIT